MSKNNKKMLNDKSQKQTKKNKSCKSIRDNEEECKARVDCLFTKTRKCWKKQKPKAKDEETDKEQENIHKPSEESQKKREDNSKLNNIFDQLPLQEMIAEEKTPDINNEPNNQITEPDILVAPETNNLDRNCLDELEQLRTELNLSRKNYDDKVRECEKIIYGDFIKKYFNVGVNKLTHRDLLVGLQKYYVEEKTRDINFILGMQEFIQKFSQKTPTEGSNYKRQHIFEALCRLLVFFNYDKGELGINKHFYKSLESFIDGKKNIINMETLLSTNVNVGSEAGIVDIFFKSKKNKEDDNLWACESISTEEKKIQEDQNEYIMIQNKYYEKEKSNISNYDVTRIYTLADRTNKSHQKFDGEPKIILMVNNGDAVSSNLLKAKQQYPGLLDKKNGIIGISVLDNWFQQIIYHLYESKTINNFLQSYKDKKNLQEQELQLRFHQKFIIECTQKSILKNVSKFIWGAVPRSGKSYMIGGLISERYKNGITNNIVIILGALTETLQQFKDMFKHFSDFLDYKIISPDSNEKEGELNIYLFSQEWLKDKVKSEQVDKRIIPSTYNFNITLKTKYPKLFSGGELFDKGKIDLYFDEVHKGGSTDISEGIIHSFNNFGISIDIFIMVTATFAKPTLRYDSVNFIGFGNNKTETIEWSYNDQQNMKSLNDETKKTMMINSRSGIQREVLNDIFLFYQTYYGSDYLSALSKEYQKHPELVLITPECINIQSSDRADVPSTIDIRNIFLNNLKCSACEPKRTIEFYTNPSNIFSQIHPVNNLLDYIYHHIYNYFKLTLNYPIDSPHTELWFLPDKHLYGTDSECKEICKPIELDHATQDEDENKTTGIPNIEPLTRGLSIKICNHKGYNMYNILIVHNTKFTYLGSGINSKNIFSVFKNEAGQERIKLFEKKKEISLAEQIKDFEKDSYRNGKSLIILTGAKLRLGISLPCADIAFNFDDIKSIDNNYQTMFRVLTERTKPELKKYGYYLDFNKDRSIQFIYEYNKIYGDAKKLQHKEALEALQALLFTFNYNGLNLIKNDTKEELTLYSDLISKLELNEEGYTKFWSAKNNIVSLIKKSLTSSGNIVLLQSLKTFMKGTKNSLKSNRREVLKEGLAREGLPFKKTNPEMEAETEDPVEENVEGDEDYGELINTIAEELPTIVALLAIFSNEEQYDCESIEDCLRKSLDNISRLPEQCSCENISDANILDCFLNSPGLIYGDYKYDKSDLKKIIMLLLELIESRDSELLRINLNFIFDNIKKLMTKNDGIIKNMNSKEIEEKIEQYLTVREEEKNKHGEVFTPIKLIEEMFDKLPSSVWSNPDLKWLDPANGIGNFPMVAYQRLMKGLEKWETSETKRSKHIIENMLYMVEINPKNVKISKKIFGSKANICCADFLEDSEKCFRQFGIDKFDIIMGNPPFQDSIEGKAKHGSGKLYPVFIEKSLEKLTTDGLLLFVTPNSWFAGGVSKTGKILELFKTYNLVKLKCNTISKYFPGVGTGNLVYFLVKKNNKYTTTELIDNPSYNFNVKRFTFLPNILSKSSLSICEKTLFNNKYDKFELIKDSGPFHLKYGSTEKTYTTRSDDNWVSTKKDTNHKYPIFHTNAQTLFSSKENFFSKYKKILISQSSKFEPFYDDAMGFTQNVSAIIVSSNKEGEHIIKILRSKLYSFLLKCIRYSTNITIYYLDFFPYPKDLPYNFTDEDLYKYFKLSQNEINYINNVDSKTKDNDITKIQALTRGHLQRKKNKKTKKGITKLQALTRGVLQRKKTKRSIKTGGSKKTRKNKSLFRFW